jgi:hypothetical protein
MQDTSANPYTVRLHSARLVNTYIRDLHLAGSRRNTQEERGEERTYKVTVNTALDPLSFFAAGAVSAWFLGHKVDHVSDNVISDVKVFKDLQKEATNQKAKTEENLKKNHESGVLESFGAAAGKFVFDAFSQKTEDLRKALKHITKEEFERAQKEVEEEERLDALRGFGQSISAAQRKYDMSKNASKAEPVNKQK